MPSSSDYFLGQDNPVHPKTRTIRVVQQLSDQVRGQITCNKTASLTFEDIAQRHTCKQDGFVPTSRVNLHVTDIVRTCQKMRR
jgi:hypothetical protein